MDIELSQHAQRDQAHFDAIADDYFKKDRLPAHRAARKTRLRQTLRGISPDGPTRILEVGCGAGFSAEYLKGNYDSFVGVDYSENLINHAHRLNKYDGADFVVADINAVNYENEFDVIVMIGLLHHLDEPSETLSRLKGWLRPGGVIAANEPQSGNKLISMLRNVRKKVDSAYSDEQLEFSAAEMTAMYQTAGLEDVRIVPQGIFSTPFAEVAMPLQPLVAPLSAAACAVDRFLEMRLERALTPLSWNLIATGRAPA